MCFDTECTRVPRKKNLILINSVCMGYMQSGELDDAERKRLERNSRRRKRRAEMTDEQRQEINRKQREYRARKKAESSYTPNAVQTPSSMAGL